MPDHSARKRSDAAKKGASWLTNLGGQYGESRLAADEEDRTDG